MAVLHSRYPVVSMDFNAVIRVYLSEVYTDFAATIMPPWYREDYEDDTEDEDS